LLVDSDANGNGLMDSVMFPTLADGESWGRPSANPTVLVRLTPTPGSANP
jgi:hypothetical protein